MITWYSAHVVRYTFFVNTLNKLNQEIRRKIEPEQAPLYFLYQVWYVEPQMAIISPKTIRTTGMVVNSSSRCTLETRRTTFISLQ